MTWVILLSVILGIIVGRFDLFTELVVNIDLVTTVVLNILLFTVGLDLGNNKEVWRKLADIGWKIILLPIGIALGSLIGALIIGLLIKYPLNYSLAVGAGFGWYSLSGVILKELVSIELGTVAFLANVFRELMAIILIPILALRIGKIVSVAPGGATCMDTTLPILSKVGGSDTALIGFISGAVLSSLVPLLVPLLVNL